MEIFESSTVVVNLPTYKILHAYDIGDRSIYIESKLSEDQLLDICAFLQFKIESTLGDSSGDLSNFGVGHALIKYFDCEPAARSDTAISLDIYCARESRCNEKLDNLCSEIEVNLKERLTDLVNDLKCYTD